MFAISFQIKPLIFQPYLCPLYLKMYLEKEIAIYMYVDGFENTASGLFFSISVYMKVCL